MTAGRKPRQQVEEAEARREDEINARVDQRVAPILAAMEELKKEIAAGRAPQQQQDQSAQQRIYSGQDMISDLVVAMQRIMDPQSKKTIFSPAEIASMDAGRAEMVRLLVEADERGEDPVYALRIAMYLGEQLVQPQYQDKATKTMMKQKIIWTRVPNESMIPLNDIAKNIHAAFMMSIGGETMNKQAGSQFVLNSNFVLSQENPDETPVGNAPAVDVRLGGFTAEPLDGSAPVSIFGKADPSMNSMRGTGFGHSNNTDGRG